MSGEFEVSLHGGQSAIYNSDARFKVCAAGRRFGKSHFAAYMLILAAMASVHKGYPLTEENGVYYVAPTFDQAKRVMWPKIRSLAGYKRNGGLIARENTNDGWIELISGRRIYIKGADNPDTLRGMGYHYVVMDEYADMKPSTWEEIIDPALMDVEGDALFIGTPKGKNHFYQLFMGAMEQEPGFDDWEAFHFKSLDNPFLNPAEIARVMTRSNRPMEVVRQELEASFVSGAGKHLKADQFNIVKAAPENAHGQICITVDLAGYSKTEGKKTLRSDETVIGATMVTDPAWYVMDMQHGHWDVREVALRIVKMCASYPGCQLGIEKGALMNAVGPYLEDYMREFHRYVTPQPLSHGNTNKLDRIIWALQGRAERGHLNLVEGPWNQWFLDQCVDLGDPLSHDDGPDTIAYVDQMATPSYVGSLDLDEWEPLDLIAGY